MLGKFQLGLSAKTFRFNDLSMASGGSLLRVRMHSQRFALGFSHQGNLVFVGCFQFPVMPHRAIIDFARL